MRRLAQTALGYGVPWFHNAAKRISLVGSYIPESEEACIPIQSLEEAFSRQEPGTSTSWPSTSTQCLTLTCSAHNQMPCKDSATFARPHPDPRRFAKNPECRRLRDMGTSVFLGARTARSFRRQSGLATMATPSSSTLASAAYSGPSRSAKCALDVPSVQIHTHLILIHDHICRIPVLTT